MLNRISFKARLIVLTSLAFLLFILVGAVGLMGMNSLNQALEDVYQEKMVPVKVLDTIYADINGSRAELLLALQHAPDSSFLDLHDHPVSRHIETIKNGQARNKQGWEMLDAITFPQKISN